MPGSRCDRIALGLCALAAFALGAVAWAGPPQAAVSIHEGRWHLDGRVTYPGAPAEGLLMNVRMINSVFEDAGPAADRLPAGFDADANTAAFVAQLPAYVAHGVRAFTIGLQGGRPGYSGNQTSAFERDGTLRPGYMARVARVIEAADAHGAVVILSCLYQSQHSHGRTLAGRDAVRAAVAHAAAWVRDRGYTNVLLEVANEPHVSGFKRWPDSAWLQSETARAELVTLARQTHPGLLVSNGGTGTGRAAEAVAEASDFILIHFNNTPIDDIPGRIAALRRYGKPIVCNEDDKLGDAGARAAALSVDQGASWGFMHKAQNQFVPFAYDGCADDPAVYAALRRLTKAPGMADERGKPCACMREP